MRCRLFCVLCFSLALLSFSGCPASGGLPIMLGNWLFAFPSFNGHIGVGIGANGAINGFEGAGMIPVGAETGLAGSVTWQQSGNTFTMIQVRMTGTSTYVGTLQSPTYMTGTVSAGGAPASFTASKAPSENLKPV